MNTDSMESGGKAARRWESCSGVSDVELAAAIDSTVLAMSYMHGRGTRWSLIERLLVADYEQMKKVERDREVGRLRLNG